MATSHQIEVAAGNEEQYAAWNGDEGERWVAHPEFFDLRDNFYRSLDAGLAILRSQLAADPGNRGQDMQALINLTLDEPDKNDRSAHNRWEVRCAIYRALLKNRRFAGFAGEWFDILQWLPFNFVLLKDGEEAGTYRRVLGKFRDRYVLELGPQVQGVDRRLVLAFSVALDALQDR